MATPQAAQTLRGLPDAQRRAIRGSCMYDWANSAYATSVIVAILPVYFVTLFKNAFGPETELLGFTLTGSSLWILAVAVSTAIVAFSSPVLGVIADRAQIKKTLLWLYTVAGSVFTVLVFFSAYTGAAWAWVLGCFLIANAGFGGDVVFYNSFLPHLASEELLDDISSRGFAYGYIGGGLLLAIHLGFILAFSGTDHLDLVTRLAIASVGIWWYGWAIWTFRTVPEPEVQSPIRGLTVWRATRMAFSELRQTFRELSRFRILAVYLLAYLLFNDGIQTVIAVAGAFGSDTLGVTLAFNMATILLVQFIAAPGAMIFSRVADRFTTKRALGVALIGWCLVIMVAIGFAPLQPEAHEDFDYQLEYMTAGGYNVAGQPELSEEGRDKDWNEAYSRLWEQASLRPREAEELASAVESSDLSRFSISIRGGPLDDTRRIGPHHPANLNGGPIDWLPRALRELVWAPLGFSIGYQWLLLGAMVGLVLGGSQALARSLFAYMTPENRSAEFFGFFGFIGRASAVSGPWFTWCLPASSTRAWQFWGSSCSSSQVLPCCVGSTWGRGAALRRAKAPASGQRSVGMKVRVAYLSSFIPRRKSRAAAGQSTVAPDAPTSTARARSPRLRMPQTPTTRPAERASSTACGVTAPT